MLYRIILFLGFFAAFQTTYAATSNCLTCHREFEDKSGPSYKITQDIHFQKGLGCVDCHGGDATLDDMDAVRAQKNWRGVPNHLQVPEFCARCHSNAKYMHNHNPMLPTDQLEKYKTSVHGKRLFRKKDMKVANCISCHTVHEINNAKAPHSSTYPLNVPFTCGKCHANAKYMKGYNIPTDQLEDFKQSVHGQALLVKKDLGAPACNSCHGNHGAAPPGVQSLAAVCGNCHAIEADLFDNSPHKVAFEENDYPMCETCHSNHKIVKPNDSFVGDKKPALCVECHSYDDGTNGLATAKAISRALSELVATQAQAKKVLDNAALKGMMTTDEEFRLNEVNQVLIHARSLVHTINADSVVAEAEKGIKKADTVKINASALIGEYYFRRKGLALATLFITILAIALYIKIKRVDKKLAGK
ncbi:MAG: hypothetical protein GXO93_07040 [FCB group bacterium]|nr:hypothetical protein [FCB group bacterium]